MRLGARLDLVVGSLSSGVRSSRVEWSARRGLLLTIEDGEGGWGQGEASPLPGYSPDALEEVERSLHACVSAGLELDLDAEPLEAARALAASVDQSLPSARCALETAALDLLARRRGVPVHRLLGGTRAEPVPLSALLHGKETDLLVGEARGWLELGVMDLKLKIGRDIEAELARIEGMRAALGDAVRLRVDANGALPLAEAPTILARLHELGVGLIEEPVPFASMGDLPGGLVPLALDESLQGDEGDAHLRQALDAGWPSAIVLKPMALGGALPSLALARLAAERGVGAIVTHLFDGPVGRAAAAALTLSIPDALPAGLAAHGGLEIWPDVETPMFDDARVVPVDLPGLGLPRLELER